MWDFGIKWVGKAGMKCIALSGYKAMLLAQGNGISMASVGEEELTPSGSGVIVGEVSRQRGLGMP